MGVEKTLRRMLPLLPRGSACRRQVTERRAKFRGDGHTQPNSKSPLTHLSGGPPKKWTTGYCRCATTPAAPTVSYSYRVNDPIRYQSRENKLTRGCQVVNQRLPNSWSCGSDSNQKLKCSGVPRISHQWGRHLTTAKKSRREKSRPRITGEFQIVR